MTKTSLLARVRRLFTGAKAGDAALRFPPPPESVDNLATIWMDVQARLAPGWWISLSAEYGPMAHWLARIDADQEALVTSWAECQDSTAEGALTGLRDRLVSASLEDAIVVGISPPSGATSAATFASAWRTASSCLPDGWWIADLRAFGGAGTTPSGWFATTAGGPAAGYAGAQARGATPELALEALSEGSPRQA